MVWEAVHKAASRKIRERGEKTYAKFLRTQVFVNKHGKMGDFVARHFLSEVRDGLFGDSIQFLISGGSHIRSEALEFFNGIGYHLVNGYGMTEIGITSVERSSKRKIANAASIGAPFGYTEYSIDSSGILLVRGKTRAARIMQNGISKATDYAEWFNTGDLMRCDKERYYFDGRIDDLIVGEDGENINPIIVEIGLQVNGADRVCLLKGHKGIMIVASVPGIFSESKLKEIYSELEARIAEAKLSGSVKKILFTHESLLGAGEFKLNRRKLSERVDKNEIRSFDPRRIDAHIEALSSGIEREIAACFANALEKDISEIGLTDDFFRDLEGTSLDYFSLLGIIKSRLGIDILSSASVKLSTVKAFCEYIKNQE